MPCERKVLILAMSCTLSVLQAKSSVRSVCAMATSLNILADVGQITVQVRVDGHTQRLQ